jgi:uncharacterized membrane protein YeaQ/YmgE (transglycosylase-associated protein family)
LLHIIWYIIVGFIVGLIARAIMSGAQHLGFIMTTLLGIAGSIVGGLIGRLFSKPEPGSAFHPAGLNHVDHRRDYFAIYLDKTGGLTNVIGLVGLVQIAGQTLRVYPALDVRPPGVRVVSRDKTKASLLMWLAFFKLCQLRM